MPQVFLNGERVNFEGPPPASISEVWALLENHLAGAGALIERFAVDGSDWNPESGSSVERYDRIEVDSISHRESAARLVEEWIAGGEALRESWHAGASRSLRVPWTEFQAESVEIIHKTEPLIGSLNALSELSQQQGLECLDALTRTTTALNEALGLAIDAIESGSCVAYSEAAAGEVYQRLGDTFSILETVVMPSLKEGGPE